MEQFLESTFLKISPSSCKKFNIYRKRINRLETLIEETVKKLMNRCESILGFNPKSFCGHIEDSLKKLQKHGAIFRIYFFKVLHPPVKKLNI